MKGWKDEKERRSMNRKANERIKKGWIQQMKRKRKNAFEVWNYKGWI